MLHIPGKNKNNCLASGDSFQVRLLIGQIWRQADMHLGKATQYLILSWLIICISSFSVLRVIYLAYIVFELDEDMSSSGKSFLVRSAVHKAVGDI